MILHEIKLKFSFHMTRSIFLACQSSLLNSVSVLNSLDILGAKNWPISRKIYFGCMKLFISIPERWRQLLSAVHSTPHHCTPYSQIIPSVSLTPLSVASTRIYLKHLCVFLSLTFQKISWALAQWVSTFIIGVNWFLIKMLWFIIAFVFSPPPFIF